MMKRDAASERQVQAARPDSSTWLAANAGSGKTRVLTDRVARLLLEDVEPQHILCLTYTKAAASEMQNRLFRRLGAWAMLPDEDLREQLFALGVTGPIKNESLRNARTLFARAIETPGGLKIQTIHSFCSSLLRRFPLEAGVTPQFTEMEERAAALLRQEVVAELAQHDIEGHVAGLARYLTSEDIEGITAEIVRSKALFNQILDKERLHQLFSIPRDLSEETLLADVFLGNETDLLSQLLSALSVGSANDIKAYEKLKQVQIGQIGALPVLESVFLNGATAKAGPFSAKIGSFPTKKTQALLAGLMPQIEDWMRRIEDGRTNRLSLNAANRTQALVGFAQAFLPAYEARKQRLGWLDFDDLILKARDLLTDPTVAAWVLYRLDGGIDHILVDEAQDTSPVQWQVIERLAQEFTSGSGARSDIARTIFVVGDKKQSIYSFQGADPREFDRMQAEFQQRLEQSTRPLVSLELEYSFRSSAAILDLVDRVFDGQADSGFPLESRHRAFKSEMPGRVDLWPLIEPTKSNDTGDWFEPVDRVSERHHSVQLAERIAGEIRAMIDRQDCIPVEIGHSGTYQKRPVREGDFLILVQRRSDLFQEIIRACKIQKLAIAGADRLKVGAELAVKDLAALLSFLSTPEDDFSLAVALRSPLFNWDEQALFDLAHRRPAKTYLWHALRTRAQEYPDTLAILNDLRNHAEFMRPYDLIERILTRHQGRLRLLGRLGDEAEDGINAFLSQALAYERSATPSLTGFLTWMETDDLEIKRQMDSAGNRIRVMTVHGAKGLEAPIVILPDTAQRPVRNRSAVLSHDGKPFWRSDAAAAPDLQREVDKHETQAQLAERDRLLYVAMTRAERWLIVAAAGNLGTDGLSWYEKVQAGMAQSNAQPHKFDFGSGLRLSHKDWDALEQIFHSDPAEVTVELPDFFDRPAPSPTDAPTTLSPSDLGGAKALAGETGQDEETAMRRGTLIHLLLEHLPQTSPDERGEYAKRMIRSASESTGFSEIDKSEMITEALQAVENPELQSLFTNEALVEVPVSANLDQLQGRRINGVIDRLIINDDHILIVDYKTNVVPPKTPDACPEGILRQMGAYGAAMAQVYPNHRIETAVLWTKTAQLMLLPHDLVTEALQNTQIS